MLPQSDSRPQMQDTQSYPANQPKEFWRLLSIVPPISAMDIVTSSEEAI
jgi:hypothetical protein